GVEGVDGAFGVGSEGDVRRRRREALRRRDEEVGPLGAQPDRGRAVEQHAVAQRGERRLVEGAAGGRVGGVELEVVDHVNEMTLRMPSWASISSKPRLTSSSEMRWERKASTS